MGLLANGPFGKLPHFGCESSPNLPPIAELNNEVARNAGGFSKTKRHGEAMRYMQDLDHAVCCSLTRVRGAIQPWKVIPLVPEPFPQPLLWNEEGYLGPKLVTF